MKEYEDKKLINARYMFNEIMKENNRQIKKHGIEKVSIFQWLSYLTEEVGKVAKSINDSYGKEINKKETFEECIQAATLLLKIEEMFIA